jgi:hypothetical protein
LSEYKLIPRRPRFEPGSGLMGFVMGHVSFQLLQFPIPIIAPSSPHLSPSSSIIRGRTNRRNCDRRTKCTQSHPTVRDVTEMWRYGRWLVTHLSLCHFASHRFHQGAFTFPCLFPVSVYLQNFAFIRYGDESENNSSPCGTGCTQ